MGVFFYFFQVGTVLGTIMFCTMFFAWATGLATFLLPIKHPELVPVAWLQKRVAGLAVAGWLGVLTVVSGLFLLYLTLRDLTWGGVVSLALLVAALLANYALRTRRLRLKMRGGLPEQALLPPE
jgi:hypothetical protein